MKFEKICKMSQETLKEYVAKELAKTHDIVISEDGFVYADGKFPVLLVAHMDTVHKKLPEFFCYKKQMDIVSSPNGIGGDDRCGIYMILEIIKKYNCSVVFCEDEEIGAVGAKKFVESEIAQGLKFNYIIEFDRKGSKDAVFYNCDNDEFEEFITKEFFKTAYGSFSDISTIAPALGVAAVNLSCGYYDAHTTKEYVVMSEMERVIREACKLLERTTDKDVFEYIESKYSYGGYGGYYGGGWEDDYYYGSSYGSKKQRYYLIEFYDENNELQWCDMVASTYDEALGRFFCENPNICYNDIVDIAFEDLKWY